MATQLTRAELAEQNAQLREENSAMLVALAVGKPSYTARHDALLSVRHYAPERHDGGSVLVYRNGPHSQPEAMCALRFEAYAETCHHYASHALRSEEAMFWTQQSYRIHQNQREALGLAS